MNFEKAYEKKDYSLAYEYYTFTLFAERNYNPKLLDSIQKISELPLEESNIVLFGRYEQDGNLENGPEPIEWIILGKDDEHALLLSKYVLDYKPIHSYDEEFDFFQTDLIDWLNNDFFDKAFKLSEKRRMVRIELSSKSLTNRSVVINKYSHAVMSESEGFNTMLGNKNFKRPESIFSYVVIPDYSDLHTLDINNDKVAYAVPALNRDIEKEKLKKLNPEIYEQIKAKEKLSESQSETEEATINAKVFVPVKYWLRNMGGKSGYSIWYRYVDEFGFESIEDTNKYLGIRPEIMIKYERIVKNKEEDDDEDEEDDY